MPVINNLPLDHIALVGYAFIFIFTLYKLKDTVTVPIELTASVLLIVGLGALITYHYRRIQTGKDENNDINQKNVRLLAHTTISAFFLLTLAPISKATFQFYDSFGLAGHLYLLNAVFQNISQLPGVALLAAYFFFAGIRKGMLGSKIGMETFTLVGRLLLLVYFTVSTINGVF
jgi:hypothetical protein